jgi:branched-subunit amino acid aminotransferase/4-amino-4-deoxychorismate lyase
VRMQAWVDGGLVPLERARVNVLDQGFRTGLGVFETMRAYGGHPFRLERHLDRATTGATRLGFEVPPVEEVGHAVRATVDANAHVSDDLAVRLTITPGPLDPHAPWPMSSLGQPTVVVTAHALHVSPALYRDGVRAVVVPGARELPDVKAVSYLTATMARRQARAFGADEALLCDRDGHVLEGASSNVFAVVDGRLVTPPTGTGLLAGVTRATVIELAVPLGLPVAESPLPLPSLLAADEVFLTASTRELVPVVRVDDTPIGDGRPGPVGERLLAAYRELVRRDRPG